jgi:hypothetical protein
VFLSRDRGSSFHGGFHGSEAGGMADEPDVSADMIRKLSPAEQLEKRRMLIPWSRQSLRGANITLW